MSMLRLGLLVVITACSAGSRVADNLQSRIDAQLASNAERHGVAGQAVMVVRDGRTLYRGTQGVADLETRTPVAPDAVFPIFSVAKLFASTLVLQLVEHGDLALDAPLGRYLPAIPERWRTITVEQVLSHVSGLPEYFEGQGSSTVVPPTRDAAFARLAARPLMFPPGTQGRYTQTNYLVIEALLEAHYQRPYRELVTDRIVAALGLRHTFVGKDHLPSDKLVKSYIGKAGRLAPQDAVAWPEYSVVHTDIFTTVDDLAAFLNAITAGRLVGRDVLLRSWRPYRLADGSEADFAAGWEYGTAGRFHYVGHDGGTMVRVRLLFGDSLAHDTYAIVYLTNGSAANVWSRTLVDSVFALVRD
jgi:CubicO group peptidase (beta-lactamase class C family)